MAMLPRIKSDFAILDVKSGRKGLTKHFVDGTPVRRVPVTIHGYIVGTWGDDDGVSREFEVDVTSVELGWPS